MLNVAIIDDEIQACNELKDCLDFIRQQTDEEFNIDIYTDSPTFLMHFDSQYNLIFLDIEMPKADGLTCAKEIRKIDKSAIIIFVTNASKYAIQGYEYEALDYIVKPIDKQVFALKMQRALKRVFRRKEANVAIKTKGGMQFLQISNIKYIEVNGHYCTYHTSYGNYDTYNTLASEIKQLPSVQFVKCNRNYVVNLRYVEAIEDDMVIISGEKLLISRPKKKKFLQDLHNYLKGFKE